MLLRASKKEGDIAWQGAKKLINFPEYKYTCIGYAGTSSSGSGSGKEFNEKILYRAKEMIEISRDEPEILPFLALLEEGIGGDRISDMTQKIIDKEICEYTIDVLKKIDFKGELRKYETAKYEKYNLPYNPYAKCVLKLLPEDILSNLPVADTFDTWTLEIAEHNERLRARINNDLGEQWRDATKKDKQEAMIRKIKEDKEFFLEIINALKGATFEHYDLKKDSEGLYRWLEDSQKFINLDSLQEISKCEDNLEAISFQVELILKQFQNLIEQQDLWRMFWTKSNNKDNHVKEFYSQMLFYVVCNSWLKAQNSNIQLFREYNKEAKQIDLRFTISSKFNILIQIKHASNNKLEEGYKKQLEIHKESKNSKCLFAIINFNEKESRQLEDIRLIKQKCCKVFETDSVQIEEYSSLFQKQEVKERLNQDFMNHDNELIKLNFEDVKIEPFEEIKLDVKFQDIDLDFNIKELEIPMIEFEEPLYSKENTIQSKGGKNSHQAYKPLKAKVEELCKTELSKRKNLSARQLSYIVAKIIEEKHKNLLKEFAPYGRQDGTDWREGSFYNWCNGVFKRLEYEN